MNSKTKMLKLKKKTTTLILEKLCRCIPHDSLTLLTKGSSTGTLTEVPITRMAYNRFDDLITAQHRVVVRNWPLKTFCNPSAVGSRTELELLYNVWKSGRTYFEQLTHEEMEAWEDSRISARVEFVPPPAELVPALASLRSPAEPVPIPALPQPPAEMTLLSELPRQDCLVLASHPFSNAPLAPVTNLTSARSASLATPRPLAPNPDTITMMIRADPALQNVDPSLIAMGIMQGNQHQVTLATATTLQIEQSSNHIPHARGLKWGWQEVITPGSFDAHMAKKPRKPQNGKQSQNSPAMRGPEN